MNASLTFRRFAQIGVKGHTEGLLSFYDKHGDMCMSLPLVKRNGLYYSRADEVVPNTGAMRPVPQVSHEACRLDDIIHSDHGLLRINELVTIHHPWVPDVGGVPTVNAVRADDRAPRRSILRRHPTSQAKQLEAELWAARMGYCSEWQVEVLPGGVTGTPNQFDPHPFQFIDMKEEARI